jgi:hypothetical protein
VALNRYVLTSTVTVNPGTAAAVVPGDPGTGGAAGHGNAAQAASGTPLWPTTYLVNTTIVLDPAGALYAAIGGTNLRAYVQGTDDRGGACLAN